MKRSSRREDDASMDDLFLWANRQPQSEATAALVSFKAWRETSPRYTNVIRPRNESVALIELRLHRRLGLLPTPPVIDLNEARPLRRA